MVHEEGRSGRGSLHTHVGNHVKDRLIAVVSDACYDGKWKVCHVLGKQKCVETGHVARRTSTTYDDNHIEIVGLDIDFIQCSNNAFLNFFTLHDGRKEPRIELQPAGIVAQLSAEVTVACRIFTRNHSDALGEKRQREFLLQVENALHLQPVDDFHALLGHVAHGEFGVDIGHNPREPVGFMEVGIDLQQHLQTRFEALSRYAFKLGA